MRLHIIYLAASSFFSSTSVYATDLSQETATPVDYVKVCEAFGSAFFYLPGTESCLRIGGRVRARVEYNDIDRPGAANDEQLLKFRADARLNFDLRTSTEYGTLRTFVRLEDDYSNKSVSDESSDDTVPGIGLVFLQLGYVTVGRMEDIANGDMLFGDKDFPYVTGDDDLIGIAVKVDDIGGGFYLGGGVYSPTEGRDQFIWGRLDDDTYADVSFEGVFGYVGDGWTIDVSAVYQVLDSVDLGGGDRYGSDDDLFTVKATADVDITDSLETRFVAAYANEENEDDVWTLAAALSLAMTDSTSIYTGAVYNFQDDDDNYAGNIGIEYMVAKGLTISPEVAYQKAANETETFTAQVLMARNW